MIKYTQTILPKPERTRKMKITKKGFKRGISAFLAAVTLSTSLTINSSATTLSIAVTYGSTGEAIVSLTPSDSANSVYYTTDGSTPTTSSFIGSEYIPFSGPVTIRVAEFTADGTRVSGKKKDVVPKAGAVDISVFSAENTTYAIINCTMDEAEIHYTIDGSKPTEASPIYTSPIFFTENTTLKAVAIRSGYKNSDVKSKVVEMYKKVTVTEEEATTESNSAQTAENNSFKESKTKIGYSFMRYAEKGYTTVTLSKKKSSDTVYYTTDGSAPTKENGKKYTKAVKFKELGVIRAAEYNKKGELVASLKVKVPIKCAPVEASCTNFVIGTKTIKLTCDTEGATIYYTLDGLTPEPGTEDTYIYNGEMTLGTGTTLTAIAMKDGYEKGTMLVCEVSEIEYVISKFNFNNPIYSEAAVLINTERRSSGLSALTLDENLTKAANIRARELSVLFNHNRPSGGDYLAAVASVGAKVRNAGEIIIANCSSPSELINAILGNSDYKKLLLTNMNGYTSIGIGYYKLRTKNYWSIIVAQSI